MFFRPYKIPGFTCCQKNTKIDFFTKTTKTDDTLKSNLKLAQWYAGLKYEEHDFKYPKILLKEVQKILHFFWTGSCSAVEM